MPRGAPAAGVMDPPVADPALHTGTDLSLSSEGLSFDEEPNDDPSDEELDEALPALPLFFFWLARPETEKLPSSRKSWSVIAAACDASSSAWLAAFAGVMDDSSSSISAAVNLASDVELL